MKLSRRREMLRVHHDWGETVNNALVPLDNLLECSVVAVVGGEAICIDERAKGVTALRERQG